MERWAANTLRTVGIILTAGFVLITSLLVILFSMCAFSSNSSMGDRNQATIVVMVGVLLDAGGIGLLVWLSRGLYRSMSTSPATLLVPGESVAAEQTPVPFHLSPAGRTAVDRVILAVAAQITISAGSWIYNQITYWRQPRASMPQGWTLLLLIPFVLYHLPYVVLIWALLKRLDRRALTYSIATPAVMILQTLLSIGVFTYYYVHHPVGFLLFVVPWALHIVILVLAYKAIQQTGLHPAPSSLLVAAVVIFVYVSVIHVGTPFLYRFVR